MKYLLGAVALGAAALSAAAGPTMGDVTIETAHGCVGLHVEMAVTLDERRRGLQYRKDVPDFGGMLFINPQPRVTTMWMLNTPISLDMLFIDARGQVVRIVERTTPESLERIPSGVAVKAVLEVAGGRADVLGIATGNQLRLAPRLTDGNDPTGSGPTSSRNRE